MPTISQSVFDSVGLSDQIIVDTYPNRVGLVPVDTAAVTDRVVQHIKAAPISDAIAATDYIPEWWVFNVDDIPISESVSIQVTHFVVEQLNTFDRKIIHVKPTPLTDSIVSTTATGLGLPRIADSSTIQDVVLMVVQHVSTDSVGVLDPVTVFETSGGTTTAIVHKIENLTLQDSVVAHQGAYGVHVEEDITLDAPVVAGATTSGITTYAMSLGDDIGVSESVEEVRAVQKTVQATDVVVTRTGPAEFTTTIIGTPMVVSVVIADELFNSDDLSPVLGFAPSVDNSAIIDDIKFGLGVPNTVGVNDSVTALPNKIFLTQPDSHLENVTKPRTSKPELQRAPEDITYRGIALPDSQNPYPPIKEEWELIRDSLLTILLTKKGQRLFVPDFGSNLWRVIFEPNDSVTSSLAREYIVSAIQQWEPRVIIRNVSVTPTEHTLDIFITVLIRRINQILNMRLDISRDTFTFDNVRAEAA